MEPPLRFSIRSSPVRVRLPKHAIGYSPAARAIGWRQEALQLWAVVLGRPMPPQPGTTFFDMSSEREPGDGR